MLINLYGYFEIVLQFTSLELTLETRIFIPHSLGSAIRNIKESSDQQEGIYLIMWENYMALELSLKNIQ